jgi:hypothetical protein
MADLEKLRGVGGLRKKQIGATRGGRSDEKPAFVARQGRILDNAETERVGEKVQSFIVIADKIGNVGKRLGHDN